jgi:hypothetical protein
MRRLDLGPIEQIAGQEEHIGAVVDGGPHNGFEGSRQIRVRQAAVKPPAAQMDIGGVIDLHERRRPWLHPAPFARN